MPEPGDSSVSGLSTDASIAGFLKGTANCYIMLSTWWPGSLDEVDNLALACHRCNLHKGPNLSGIDPLTGDPVSPAARPMGRPLRVPGRKS